MSAAAEPTPTLLYLVGYEAPILREQIPEISFPLSAEDRGIIASMRHSIQPASLSAAGAPWPSAVGMAGNQWGLRKRIFMYAPSGDTLNAMQTIINPTYEILSSPTDATAVASTQPGSQPNDVSANVSTPPYDELWEGCFSVPLARGLVRRPLHIRARWQDDTGTVHEKVMSHWDARVWQHENDHLNGTLYDCAKAGKCLKKTIFKDQAEADAFKQQVAEERARAAAKAKAATLAAEQGNAS